jgi:hypothetical protein
VALALLATAVVVALVVMSNADCTAVRTVITCR